MSAQQDLQDLLRLLKARSKSMMNALKQANALQAKGLKRFFYHRTCAVLAGTGETKSFIALRRLPKRHWQPSRRPSAPTPRKRRSCRWRAKAS